MMDVQVDNPQPETIELLKCCTNLGDVIHLLKQFDNFKAKKINICLHGEGLDELLNQADKDEQEEEEKRKRIKSKYGETTIGDTDFTNELNDEEEGLLADESSEFVTSDEECEEEKKSESDDGPIEEINFANLPWPIDKSYFKILKKRYFPLDRKIDNKKQCKRIYLNKLPDTNQIINDVLDEGDELFTTLGYKDLLIKVFESICRAKPIPAVPHEYLQVLSTKQDLQNDTEYQVQLAKLSKLLMHENKLASDLHKIKALLSQVDDDRHDLNYKTEEEFAADMSKMSMKLTVRDSIFLEAKLKQLKAEEDAKKLDLRRQLLKRTMRHEQVKEDIILVKSYQSPILVPNMRDEKMKVTSLQREWFDFTEIQPKNPPKKEHLQLDIPSEFDCKTIK